MRRMKGQNAINSSGWGHLFQSLTGSACVYAVCECVSHWCERKEEKSFNKKEKRRIRRLCKKEGGEKRPKEEKCDFSGKGCDVSYDNITSLWAIHRRREEGKGRIERPAAVRTKHVGKRLPSSFSSLDYLFAYSVLVQLTLLNEETIDNGWGDTIFLDSCVLHPPS